MSGAGMQALRNALGDRLAAEGETITVTPANEIELATVLRLLREGEAGLDRRVRVSRAALCGPLQLDVRSATVEAGAGWALTRLEQELRLRDLSLGPLSPGTQRLELAAFLEGPYAGLRAIPGGRLEPMPLALVAMMADGLRYVSRPSPRSAAGPDLDALFLGGEGRFGLVVQATLRCFPRPRAEHLAVYSFEAAESAVAAVRAALAQGCWFRRVSLLSRGGRFLLGAQVQGSPEGVERDLASLGQEVFSRGGRSSGQDPVVAQDETRVERELAWPEVRALLVAGRPLTLYRLSLETAIASGLEEGGVPFAPGGWTNAQTLEAALAQADPEKILGGAP